MNIHICIYMPKYIYVYINIYVYVFLYVYLFDYLSLYIYIDKFSLMCINLNFLLGITRNLWLAQQNTPVGSLVAQKTSKSETEIRNEVEKNEKNVTNLKSNRNSEINGDVYDNESNVSTGANVLYTSDLYASQLSRLLRLAEEAIGK
jgi:hypothetical protein